MNGVFKYHLPRILHQLGRPIRFGSHQFKIAGYYPCRFTSSSDQHERFLEVVLRRVLATRPGTFVDVGVNTGQTLAKVLSIDKDRAYLGFEPQLTCCFNAEQFIMANGLINARVLPIALSNNNQLISFYSDGETDECASLIDRGGLGGKRVAAVVQCRIGDEVLQELGIEQISVIKIDVEGAEAQVLEGLKRTLAVQRPVVIFEMLPNFSGINVRSWHDAQSRANNWASAAKILDLLRQADYQIHRIEESTGAETRIEEFDLDNIDDFKGSNFIAQPLPV